MLRSRSSRLKPKPYDRDCRIKSPSSTSTRRPRASSLRASFRAIVDFPEQGSPVSQMVKPVLSTSPNYHTAAHTQRRRKSALVLRFAYFDVIVQSRHLGGLTHMRLFTNSARCIRHRLVKSRARGASLGVAALCAFSTLAWTTSSLAYCRTMSCELGEAPDHPCPRDENQCVTKGHPLHWGSSCLTYTVQVDGSPRSKLDADQVQGFVEQAFSAWKAAHCPGGGSPNFEVEFQGYVSCDRHEVICESAAKNDNVIMFHDYNWVDGAGRIGVTTPTGGKESGLIVDADIEINSMNYKFDVDAHGSMPTSLLYVLTHEVGHFLGLAHSPVSGAVMSTGYQSLPFTPNLITADDAAAICAAFPPGPKLKCGAPSTPP